MTPTRTPRRRKDTGAPYAKPGPKDRRTKIPVNVDNDLLDAINAIALREPWYMASHRGQRSNVFNYYLRIALMDAGEIVDTRGDGDIIQVSITTEK